MVFRDYIDSAPRGTAAALARTIGVSPVMVVQWSSGAKSIPSDRCPALERASEGKVTCEEMRPDVVWHRVPDATWPHPDGRPLIDVAANATKAVHDPSADAGTTTPGALNAA